MDVLEGCGVDTLCAARQRGGQAVQDPRERWVFTYRCAYRLSVQTVGRYRWYGFSRARFAATPAEHAAR
jgi:hypothetical protein